MPATAATALVPWKQSDLVPSGPKPATALPVFHLDPPPVLRRSPRIKNGQAPCQAATLSSPCLAPVAWLCYPQHPQRRSRTGRSQPSPAAVAGMAAAARGKAPSLVVAASMGAVEALKDQAGLCRWDYALRSLYHRAAAPRIQSLSAALSDSVSAAAAAAPPRGPSAAGAARMRKAYHLVCWGPN